MNGNEQRVDGRTFWWFDFQKVSTLLDFADSDCCWVKRCWSSSKSIHTQTELELTLNCSDEARVNTASSYQRHLLHNQRSGDEMLALISKRKSNSRLEEWCDEMSDHAEQRSEMWKQRTWGIYPARRSVSFLLSTTIIFLQQKVEIKKIF